MPCTAQGTEGNREAHPNTSFPQHCSYLGPVPAQQGRRSSEALLEAHPQAPSGSLMQFGTLQQAVPTLGWHRSLRGQVRNQIRELILTEITWWEKYRYFFLESSPWLSLLCGIHRYAYKIHQGSKQQLRLLVA